MNKEIKHFFYQHNILNKGFAAKYENTYNGVGHKSYDKNLLEEFNQLIPDPEVIQAYEDIMPGSVSKLIKLMEQEQQHKHSMEKVKFSIQKTAAIMSKIFACFTVIVIGFVTTNIAKNSLNHAVIFSSIAFFGMFGMSMIATLKSLNKTFYKSKKYNKFDNQNVINQANDEKSVNDYNNRKEKQYHRKPIYKK